MEKKQYHRKKSNTPVRGKSEDGKSGEDKPVRRRIGEDKPVRRRIGEDKPVRGRIGEDKPVRGRTGEGSSPRPPYKKKVWGRREEQEEHSPLSRPYAKGYKSKEKTSYSSGYNRPPESQERPFKKEQKTNDYPARRKGFVKQEKPRTFPKYHKEHKGESDTYQRPRDDRKPYQPFDRKQGKKSFARNKGGKYEDPTRDVGPTRLNKYIANSGICSRRDADLIIKNGGIKVNDTVVTEMGYQVQPGDKVWYKGKRIFPELPVYILLNKPKDVITTTLDDRGRTTVMDLVSEVSTPGVFPVGRLDRNTTGVILLTNDGELAQKLTHPSFLVKKVYEVTLTNPITSREMESLLEGVKLEDGLSQVDVVACPDPANKRVVMVEIHSGKNRVVRRMFEAIGHEVVKLDRLMFGSLSKKGIKRGKYRLLKGIEVAALKKSKKKFA
jgi:23S rRNA pseudouridine2605 synthase